MIYSGFKDDSGSVWVSGFKNGLRFAAFPGSETAAALKVMQEIYPSLSGANNVLETGLRNVNTVFHAPIMVLNAGFVEHTKGDFLFYWDGCSPAVQRVVERIEEERMAIGRAFDLPLTPNLEVMRTWYGHQGAKGETLGEIMSTNPAYEWDTAPKSLQHRFILEDIPYGMVPMEEVARVGGIPTPVTTSIIELCQVLVDKDLRSEARDLRAMGLLGMSKDELKRFFDTGPATR
jgi:opine dehydrogenase